LRTAGYHQVCATDEDGYDGRRSGEYWEQCGVFPERIDYKPIRTMRHKTQRSEKEMANGYEKEKPLIKKMEENTPVGTNSFEPFPVLNQSGLPSPER